MNDFCFGGLVGGVIAVVSYLFGWYAGMKHGYWELLEQAMIHGGTVVMEKKDKPKVKKSYGERAATTEEVWGRDPRVQWCMACLTNDCPACGEDALVICHKFTPDRRENDGKTDGRAEGAAH